MIRHGIKNWFISEVLDTTLTAPGEHIEILEAYVLDSENYAAAIFLHSSKLEILDKWNKSVIRINTLSYDKTPVNYLDRQNNDRWDIREGWKTVLSVWNVIWILFTTDVPSGVCKILVPLAFRKPEVKFTCKNLNTHPYLSIPYLLVKSTLFLTKLSGKDLFFAA